MTAPRSCSDGYTLVEVVLVIVILAILGTVAGPRFFDNAAFDERAYYDELVSALRYAQKVAIASGCGVRVDVAATSYALAQQTPQAGHCDPADASFPTPVRLSTGEVMSGSAPAGISAAPAVTLIYSPLGRTTMAANQTLSVGSHTLTIQAESGLVVTP
ncbi:MAG: GspH/FimT family pseudopilin [Gammaproteobacteria bacterium]|nr:GspH/FimT family pseudopilin [Gammaproteobacteria bacterium]